MIKAVSSLHCRVVVGTSSTEQSGHLQMPGSRRHDQGCVFLHCPALVNTSSTKESGHLQVSASRRHDQGCVFLHCLAFVGASSTEQSGHHQVPASRRHDQGCVIVTLPCVCRCQLHRAAGPPPCARIDDMIKPASPLHCLVFVGASSTEQSGHRHGKCPD